MHSCYLQLILQLSVFALTISSAPTTSSNLVDLGYASHAVSFTNITASGHNINVYQNIRFAQPPTGDLRFLRPVTPPPNSSNIHNGQYDFDTRCVSAVPEGAGSLFPGLNGSSFGSEDCLFLDVYVPENVTVADSVPVLHQMYGSAYAFGAKNFAFTPLGLFDAMLNQTQPFILVASNYRMGLYGWVASPYENMDANVGLWDALTALQWTQQYIRNFGGDPSRVTAIGQSAGSAMLELLAVSPRLADNLPFQRMFSSSPALPLKRNVTTRRQEVYQAVLNATNCTDVTCLRSTSQDSFANVNLYLVNDVPNLGGGGNFGPGIGFGPVVDGYLVPDLTVAYPNLTTAARGLEGLITGNMQNEGEIVSSDQNMPEAFPGLLRRIIPSASNMTIQAIQTSYTYPPDLPEQIAWEWTADAVFVCHNIALTKAISKGARRYVMSIPPAWHGQDVNYYFFTDNTTTPVADPETAVAFQKMIGNFIYGNDEALNEQWPLYDSEMGNTFLNITSGGFEVDQTEGIQIDRCALINSVFVDAENGV